MTIPSRITEEARKLIDNGNCADCINDMHCDCFERYCGALTAVDAAAEQRGREMERATIDAVHDILRADDRYGALAHLPAGGVECEKMVEKAVDLLAAAIRSRTTEG